jgi:Uroporphyrinogen-III decarboxylase
MTGYERMMKAFAGEETDRIPAMLHCFMASSREYGITQEQYRNSPELIASSHIAFAEKYGLDGIVLDIDTCMEASALGVPVDYPEDDPARVTGPISDNIDVVKKAILPSKLLECRRIDILLETVRILKERVGGEILIRGNCDQMAFSLASLCLGMEEFLVDLLDEDMEDDILEILDRCTDVHIAMHRLVKEAGADITSFGDSVCSPDLVSPAMFRRFSLPFHNKLRAELKADGIKTICHICGKTDSILNDMADIGYEAVEIDYKTDISKAAEIFNGKSLVSGIIDPSGVFYLGSPELVERKTKEVLDIFNGKGIIPGAGCALPAGVPEENIRAFVKTVREYK